MVAAETIRQARAEAGLTQSELARRAGIRQASISKFESGRERPRPETYARILEAARIRPGIALQRHRAEVIEAARRRRASNVRVFGSIARGEDDFSSGVDLLVTFEEDASVLDAAGLMLDLEKIVGVRVDVLSDRVDGSMRDRAIAEAIAL
jgi:uncharacterized protein